MEIRFVLYDWYNKLTHIQQLKNTHHHLTALWVINLGTAWISWLLCFRAHRTKNKVLPGLSTFLEALGKSTWNFFRLLTEVSSLQKDWSLYFMGTPPIKAACISTSLDFGLRQQRLLCPRQGTRNEARLSLKKFWMFSVAFLYLYNHHEKSISLWLSGSRWETCAKQPNPAEPSQGELISKWSTDV